MTSQHQMKSNEIRSKNIEDMFEVTIVSKLSMMTPRIFFKLSLLTMKLFLESDANKGFYQ